MCSFLLFNQSHQCILKICGQCRNPSFYHKLINISNWDICLLCKILAHSTLFRGRKLSQIYKCWILLWHHPTQQENDIISVGGNNQIKTNGKTLCSPNLNCLFIYCTYHKKRERKCVKMKRLAAHSVFLFIKYIFSLSPVVLFIHLDCFAESCRVLEMSAFSQI